MPCGTHRRPAGCFEPFVPSPTRVRPCGGVREFSERECVRRAVAQALREGEAAEHRLQDRLAHPEGDPGDSRDSRPARTADDRDPVRGRARSGPQRAGPGADLDHLLQRRPDRDAPVLGGQPGVGAAVRRAAARAGRDARRRGPQLLRQPRVLAERHQPRGVGGGQRRPDPGWLDDHAAIREKLFPHPGPDDRSQGARTDHLDQGRAAAVQAGDSAELPQHDLFRSRRLRHPGGLAGLLQQDRRPALGG